MTRGALRLGAALGAAALSTMTIAPAFATHNGTGEADSSASTGTGAIFQLLDTGMCKALDTATTTTGNPPTGRCGDGLSLNAQINAFSQNASAPGNGTSAADASVAPIDITNFGALDLTGILDGLSAIDTGTVLDDVIGGATAALQPILQPLEAAAIAPIDNALQSALAQVGANLPLTVQIGAVESYCKATGSPLRAEGNGTVAGIKLLVKLGTQQISVPITAGTAPNSNLLIGAPQDLVDDIIAGLEASFTQSLGGALAPLNQVLSTVQQQVTDMIFSQLEAQLLPAVADALAPIIKGTVNEQNPVSPSSTGEISVASLDLTLLGNNNLKLGRTHCGPDKVGTPHGTPPPPPNPPPHNPPHHPGGIPTQVDSGLGGTDTGTIVLIATGALMLAAGVTGAAGYRRLLQK